MLSARRKYSYDFETSRAEKISTLRDYLHNEKTYLQKHW